MKTKSTRGFASMTKDKLAAVSSKGGKRSHGADVALFNSRSVAIESRLESVAIEIMARVSNHKPIGSEIRDEYNSLLTEIQ